MDGRLKDAGANAIEAKVARQSTYAFGVGLNTSQSGLGKQTTEINGREPDPGTYIQNCSPRSPERQPIILALENIAVMEAINTAVCPQASLRKPVGCGYLKAMIRSREVRERFLKQESSRNLSS